MFLYWLLFPFVLGATLLGLGLGLRRLTTPFAAPLLLPAGYAAAITVSVALCVVPETTFLAGPAVIVLALAGWAFGWRDVLAPAGLRRQLPWILAGLAAFVAFGFSTLMYGHPTSTGASQIVDIAHQFDFSWWVGTEGRTDPGRGLSSAMNVVSGGVDEYPWGPQSLLGTFPRTLGLTIDQAWQPMLAILAANIVAAVYALLRQLIESPRFAAVGAFAAGQASALVSYGQIGGVKELASAGLLVTAASFALLLRTPDRAAWRTALPITVVAAGAFSIFSLTLLPWLALTVLGGLLVVWRTVTLRAALVRAAWIVGIGAVISIPTIIPAFASLDYANQMGSQQEVGNLAAPLSRWAATGIWITNDHRYALEGSFRTLSIVLGSVVIGLAVVGFSSAVRRRALPVVILTTSALSTMVVLVARMGPWVELKGIVLASPVVLLLAILGLGVLLRHEWSKGIAWGGVAVLVVVGLWSDALRYGSTQVASHDRYAELRRLDAKYAGVRRSLYPDFDEHAEFQLRRINAAAAFNSDFIPTDDYVARATQDSLPAKPYEWDLDDLDAAFLQRFDLIVARRAPVISRPPQNFDLVEQGRYYDVWRRTAAPGPTTRVALGGAADITAQEQCETFLDGLPKGATATIAQTTIPATAIFDSLRSSSHFAFNTGNTSFAPGPSGRGRAVGKVSVPSGGKYEVYVTSNSLRKVTIRVDGRTLPAVPLERTYAIRAALLTTLTLEAGEHDIELVQAGSGLSVGGGDQYNAGAKLGPVTFIPAGQLHPPLLRTAPPLA